MRKFVSSVVLIALALGSAFAAGAGTHFDANLKIAEANDWEEGGAEYNVKMYRYFKDSSDTSAMIESCMGSDLPKHPVKGYINFHDAGGYTVELRPAGALATCVVGAFSGRNLPEPP